MSMAPVLFVTTVLARDGAGRALEALAACLPPRRHVTVCSLTFAEPPMAARLAAAGVCRELRPAIVHTQLSRADWIGRFVAAAVRVPHIVSTIQNVHSAMYRAEFGWKGALAGAAFDRCTSPLAHHLVAVSKGVQQDTVAAGVNAERVTIIPNGIDLTRRRTVLPRAAARTALGLGPDEAVIGCSALLKPQKGLDDLVEAAALLSGRGCRATVAVLGDGPLRQALDARAARLAAGSTRLRFIGWTDDAMAWMPAFDVFVLPSRWEGLPIALLEAMSLGIPAIGTRVSGIEDVIDHDVTGWLVEAANPLGLADRLAETIASPAERARVGEAGREAVEARFSADAVAAAHDRLYQRLLGRKQSD
jgi:glycosyltransferase involved in cell wall biosynthesis